VDEFLITFQEAVEETPGIAEAVIVEQLLEVDPVECPADISDFTTEVAIPLFLLTELTNDTKNEMGLGFVARYNLLT